MAPNVSLERTVIYRRPQFYYVVRKTDINVIMKELTLVIGRFYYLSITRVVFINVIMTGVRGTIIKLTY